MNNRYAFTAVLAALVAAPSAIAHHSFAVYDFATSVEFAGVVEEIKFRNPHISMTLRVTDESGASRIIDFVESAPANMAVRMGVRPEMLAEGTPITAIGSPRHDNPDALFLNGFIEADGTEHNLRGGGPLRGRGRNPQLND